MDWTGIISTGLGGIASAASGGIFGAIGSGFGAIAKYFQAKQEHKQRVEMIRLQMEVNSQQGSWEGLKESLLTEQSGSNTYKWVNAVRALYRPVLTSALVIIAYIIFLDLLDVVNGSSGDSVLTQFFTDGEIKELLKYIVYSLVFSACTAIVWWFGDRAFTPPGLKNR